MSRLIDADAFLRETFFQEGIYPHEQLKKEIENTPTVDAVKLPCMIGDYVWAIRNYKGIKHPERGVVSEMFFSTDMKLCIAVKHIARGEWGKIVFATDKEAYAAIGERKGNG